MDTRDKERRVLGPFELVETIREASDAALYIARLAPGEEVVPLSPEQTYVIKVYSPLLCQVYRFHYSWERIRQIIKDIRSPHLASVLHTMPLPEQKCWVVVMENCAGTPLLSLPEVLLPPEQKQMQLFDWTEALCKTLDFLGQYWAQESCVSLQMSHWFPPQETVHIHEGRVVLLDWLPMGPREESFQMRHPSTSQGLPLFFRDGVLHGARCERAGVLELAAWIVVMLTDSRIQTPEEADLGLRGEAFSSCQSGLSAPLCRLFLLACEAFNGKVESYFSFAEQLRHGRVGEQVTDVEGSAEDWLGAVREWMYNGQWHGVHWLFLRWDRSLREEDTLLSFSGEVPWRDELLCEYIWSHLDTSWVDAVVALQPIPSVISALLGFLPQGRQKLLAWALDEQRQTAPRVRALRMLVSPRRTEELKHFFSLLNDRNQEVAHAAKDLLLTLSEEFLVGLDMASMKLYRCEHGWDSLPTQDPRSWKRFCPHCRRHVVRLQHTQELSYLTGHRQLLCRPVPREPVSVRGLSGNWWTSSLVPDQVLRIGLHGDGPLRSDGMGARHGLVRWLTEEQVWVEALEGELFWNGVRVEHAILSKKPIFEEDMIELDKMILDYSMGFEALCVYNRSASASDPRRTLAERTIDAWGAGPRGDRIPEEMIWHIKKDEKTGEFLSLDFHYESDFDFSPPPPPPHRPAQEPHPSIGPKEPLPLASFEASHRTAKTSQLLSRLRRLFSRDK